MNCTTTNPNLLTCFPHQRDPAGKKREKGKKNGQGKTYQANHITHPAVPIALQNTFPCFCGADSMLGVEAAREEEEEEQEGENEGEEDKGRQ